MSFYVKKAGIWQSTPASQLFTKQAGTWVRLGPAWQTTKRVAFPGTTVSNVQVRLVLTSSNFTYASANADGSDLRFTLAADSDVETEYLNYWIEKWVLNGTSIVWFKVPTAGTTQVFMHYQSPSSVDAQSEFTSFMEAGLRFEAHANADFSGWSSYYGNDLNLNQESVVSGGLQIAGQTVPAVVSGRWEGWIVPEFIGNHVFGFNDDDGGRAWLEDTQIYNVWAAGGMTEYQSTVTLSDVKPKRLKYEWYDGGGNGGYKMGMGTRTGRRTNLCENPSFEVNTTGWVLWQSGGGSMARITTDSFLGAAGACLELTKATTTDHIFAYQDPRTPVVAGTFYSLTAYLKLASGTAGAGLVRIEWKNAAGSTISSSEPSIALTGSWAKYGIAAVAPAGAVTALFVIGAYNLTAGGTVRLDAIVFERATVTTGSYIDGSYSQMGWNGTAHASTSYFLSNSRVNAVVNPRAVIDTSGFAALNGSQTLSRRTDDGVVGSTCFQTVMDAIGQMGIHQFPIDVPTMTGDPWNFSVWVKSTNDVSTVTVRILFYAADGTTVLLNSPSNPAVALTSAWQRLTHTATAPAGSAYVRVRIATVSTTVPIGGSLRATGFLLERTNTLGTYFDGDLAPAAWRGTAHDSFSLLYASDRVNLVTNPTFGVNTAGWEATNPTDTTLTRESGAGFSGTGFARLTNVTGVLNNNNMRQPLVLENLILVIPGEIISSSVYAKTNLSPVVNIQPRIHWYKSDLSASATTLTNGTSVPLTASWALYALNGATVPADAAYAQVRYATGSSATLGGYIDYDAWTFERIATTGSYFDGTTSGCSWTGTAHASASQLLATNTTIAYPFTRSQVYGPKSDPAFRGAMDAQTAIVAEVPVGLSGSVPQDVSIWLDASDTASITFPSSIRNWLNKSGLSGRDFAAPSTAASPASGTRTINSLNALDFDGTDDYLVGPTVPIVNCEPGRRWTVFAVWNDDNATDTKSIISQNFSLTLAERRFQLFQSSNVNNPMQIQVKGNGFAFRAAHLAAAQLVSARWNGTNVRTKNVGVGDGSVVTTTGSPGAFADTAEIGSKWKVGARTNGTNFDTVTGWQDGAIAEVLVYERALSDAEEDAVISYLRTKWGI